MIAGPNGAGKTTLTRLLRQRGLSNSASISIPTISRASLRALTMFVSHRHKSLTMELLCRAISASDEAFVFDNSATALFATGSRLVFRRSCAAERDAEIQQFAPIPDWVRRYVLDPLQIDPRNDDF
jgi:predicted ABC-type ATPase